MSIFLNILFLVVGMILLIKGADLFVSGASAVAKKFKIPTFLIGLTIVAIGTSLPELSVSITGAIKGATDLSVGNIVGSNMVNMLFILGLVSAIKPIKIDRNTKKINLPFMLGITLVLLLFACDVIINKEKSNIVTRSEGIVLIVVLVIYLCILVNNARKLRRANIEREELPDYIKEKEEKVLKPWQFVIYIVLGLVAVVFGSECVCSTSQFLALKMGMSETLVGLTIVAIGTSLPELATSVIASIKGENDLALGNIIGSNIINIALVLGAVGTISQITLTTAVLWDILILTACTLLFSLICVFRKQNINRWIGILLIITYIAYMTFAVVRNYCF